jgi:hypothetical protein
MDRHYKVVHKVIRQNTPLETDTEMNSNKNPRKRSLEPAILNKDQSEICQPKSPMSEFIEDTNDSESDTRFECEECWFTSLTKSELSDHYRSKHAETEDVITQSARLRTVPKVGINISNVKTPTLPAVQVKTTPIPLPTAEVKPVALPLSEVPVLSASTAIVEPDTPLVESNPEPMVLSSDYLIETKEISTAAPESTHGSQIHQEVISCPSKGTKTENSSKESSAETTESPSEQEPDIGPEEEQDASYGCKNCWLTFDSKNELAEHALEKHGMKNTTAGAVEVATDVNNETDLNSAPNETVQVHSLTDNEATADPPATTTQESILTAESALVESSVEVTAEDSNPEDDYTIPISTDLISL